MVMMIQLCGIETVRRDKIRLTCVCVRIFADMDGVCFFYTALRGFTYSIITATASHIVSSYLRIYSTIQKCITDELS
jgi:hypothetical protein